MVWRFLFSAAFIVAICITTSGQVVINEVLSSNNKGITDEDGEFTDWFELFNSSGTAVNLDGYVIKDKLVDSVTWTFPNIEIAGNSHLLVYASGKDRKNASLHYKTIINEGDQWQYLIPSGSLSDDWRLLGFNAVGWSTGASGFGFGDDDDRTQLSITNSLYIRKEFQISSVASVQKMILHVDFDDAFLVTINGTLVASENVSVIDGDLNNIAITSGHEAVMYTGGNPNQYVIDISGGFLREGTNVIAIQGYNNSTGSSDFSLIPFLTIGSDSYAVNDVADFISIEKGGLHTNFKISKDGETLYLFNANQQLIDSAAVVSLPPDVSYGRFKDGSSSWFYFTDPTPGVENVNPVNELRHDTVVFSVNPGMYSSAIQVGISTTTPNGEIRFTTDGSEPTINSDVYTGILSIDASKVVRAASFLDSIISSSVFSATYIIGQKHKLPVVSISTDPKNFWDYNEGLLVEGPDAVPNNEHPGANYWKGWEKPVNIEYFDNMGVEQINQGAGVQVTGGWSRVNTQKSLALFARKKYGKGSFEYPFFHDRESEKYESFNLRNSGNDWSSSMMRDGFVSEIAKNLNIDRLAYQPTVIYLNGSYWGILNMRERPNEGYFENNYGIEEDNLNILQNGGDIVFGKNNSYLSMVNYLNSNTLTLEEKYKKITNQIDVDCFIDYQLLQIYINNTDWPGNNIKFWKSNEVNSRWRWLLYDTDFGLSLSGNVAQDAIAFATATNGPSWPNPPWSTLLLRRMLSNDGFRYSFINRMADYMNTRFEPVTMISKLDSVSDNIKTEIGQHSELWGRNYNQWVSSLQLIKYFITNRPRYMRTYFIKYFSLNKNCEVTLNVSDEQAGIIQVSTIRPGNYPFVGTYFSNVPIPFKALPKPGYKFVRWENASSSTDPEIQLTLNDNITLNAVFEPVMQPETDVVINEINYQSDSTYNSGDWIELYNAGYQTVDLTGWVISDGATANNFAFHDGLMLYPRSYLVVCGNEEKFWQVYPEVKNHMGSFNFGLSSGGDIITLYNNSGTIVDYVMYETQAPWPNEPIRTAATIQLNDPNSDNSLSDNWGNGPIGGTPGVRNNGVTGVEDISTKRLSATCFPNCFSDFTTLSVSSEGKGDYSIQIIDMQGRVLKVHTGQFAGNETYYIDLFADGSNYSKGVYLVKVKTDRGIETLKVVKQ